MSISAKCMAVCSASERGRACSGRPAGYGYQSRRVASQPLRWSFLRKSTWRNLVAKKQVLWKD